MTCITNRYKRLLLLWACILSSFLLSAQELDTASVSVYADSLVQETVDNYQDEAASEELVAPETEQEVKTHSLWDRSVPVNVDSMEEWWINGGLVERKVPETILSKLRADKGLQYDRKDPAGPRRNDWIFRALMSLVSFLQQIRMLIVILVVAGLLLLIFYFMRQQGFRFSKGGQDDMPGTEEIDPGVSGYEQQVQDAISREQFRQAVRFLHLQTLRLLADRELIVLSKDKTNADYLRVLLKTRWYEPFARLTRDYEYIWYGDVNVNAAQFNRIHGQFRQLINELGFTR